ncbi:DUF2530 domain-containing protein [Ornithinimicrobium cryptoxanthini]|uniref:DUF2530 domain-containing protein n=1 Tax=Ornithinimicrobium cryptoxanthini TaxID=2934161 RepID=A0ABY4YJR6_9MICO|nr:DUF2530 domain-containing protein [Ornithinimicrobium cryptoxanthini]USQ76776.1 DUF2530 domain-containing protein [Ornithinimicrobium cryptoxanthini]
MSQPPGTEGPHRPESAPPEIVPPVATLRTLRVVHWGILAWAVALVLVLVLPSLREGDRSWWVWVPVAGIGLGVVGHVYLARGRGNAADA